MSVGEVGELVMASNNRLGMIVRHYKDRYQSLYVYQIEWYFSDNLLNYTLSYKESDVKCFKENYERFKSEINKTQSR